MSLSQSHSIPQTLREDLAHAQLRYADALITYHRDGSEYDMVVLWQNTLNDLCQEAAGWLE